MNRTPRARRHAGFSLLETLGATALVGLCVMTTTTLLPVIERETRAQESRAQHFEGVWLPVTKLRADVHRAVRARVSASGGLGLEDARGAMITWTVEGGELVREAAGTSHATGLEGAADSFRVESVNGRSLVVYAVGPVAERLRGRALVGGEPGARR